jgi:hypothetical protein
VPKRAALPATLSIVAKLKAMSENYSGGHCWDSLDSVTCSAAAVTIEHLLATPTPVAQPPAPHPKSELATRCETALDSLEAMLGGRNGPSIQLRAWVRELSTVDGGPPTAAAQQPAELTQALNTAAWALRHPDNGWKTEAEKRALDELRPFLKAQGGSQ